jgi:Cell shape-determining protein
LSNNEIEVRLLILSGEYISIKTTKEFFCIAKGDGEALTISCLNESKAVSYEIGDTFFTTGFDGIYPAGLIVGRLKNIENIENNLFRQKLDIELFFDPFKSINKRAILHE